MKKAGKIIPSELYSIATKLLDYKKRRNLSLKKSSFDYGGIIDDWSKLKELKRCGLLKEVEINTKRKKPLKDAEEMLRCGTTYRLTGVKWLKLISAGYNYFLQKAININNLCGADKQGSLLEQIIKNKSEELGKNIIIFDEKNIRNEKIKNLIRKINIIDSLQELEKRAIIEIKNIQIELPRWSDNIRNLKIEIEVSYRYLGERPRLIYEPLNGVLSFGPVYHKFQKDKPAHLLFNQLWEHRKEIRGRHGKRWPNETLAYRINVTESPGYFKKDVQQQNVFKNLTKSIQRILRNKHFPLEISVKNGILLEEKEH